jgi:Zn-dependent M28 family amino/carboxypeptidase
MRHSAADRRPLVGVCADAERAMPSRSSRLALVVACFLLIFASGSTVAQELGLEPGHKTGWAWITVAKADLDSLKSKRATEVLKDGLQEFETHDGVTLLRVREQEVAELSRIMHREYHRCGGFIFHETMAEALDHLYVRRAADPQQLFVTYTIDNPTVANALINEVQAPNIVSTINLLAGNTTRYYTSSGGVNAANQLKSRWEGYATGRSDVSVALYTHATWAQPSVIATITGTTLPSEVVVIGGHLDSINSSNPTTGTAPGADDDASGVASLTEAFRAAMAKGFRPQRTVKFMAYAAEEVGLRGSKEIAQAHKAQGINVVGVLQLDMTNFKGSSVDMAFLTDFTNAAQTTFLRDLLNTYLPTLSHTTTACGYGCSDHASWHNEGFPASMPSEAIFGQHNQNLHKTTDTLANSDPAAGHAAKFARLATAYIAELAKGSLAPATPDFAVSCSPSSLTVAPGSSSNTTCTISSSGGFNAAVGLTCAGLPVGVSCTFAPNSVTPPANGNITSTLTVAANVGVAGNWTFQVNGTNGTTTRSTTLGVSVTTNQITTTFFSVAAEDGRIWESGETTNVGSTGNSTDNATGSLRVGDFSDDTQYRSIISFDTSALPDGATIVSATLRLKRGTVSGTSPFTTHGTCTVDVAGATGFGGAVAFAGGDFQAAASASGVASMSNAATNGTFSSGALNAAGRLAINKTGKTQFRVYFTLDDNDDLGTDYMGFYSGEAASGNRPELVVTYQ